LLVELLRVINDIGVVDLLCSILCLDFFNSYRHGLFSVVQDVHDIFDDGFSELNILLFGFSGL
jgi:hypothetical protein